MAKPLIHKQLDEDLELGLRVLSSLEAVNRRMADRLPTLAAANYDAERAGAVAWCDTHEREVTACRRKRLLCRGVPLPKVTDRTGDAAISAVLEHAWSMSDYAAMVHVGIEGMAGICRMYRDDEDPAAEKVTEQVEEANRPKCQVHLRHGYLTDARGKEPTRVGHKGTLILEVPLRLCEWCEKKVRAIYAHDHKRRVPNAAEVRQHANRVGLPACIVVEPAARSNDDIDWWAHSENWYQPASGQ